MGLDTVELVMAIEDEFAIEIPNAEAERIRTVGDISDYVAQAVRLKMRPVPVDEEIWLRTRKVVIEQLGVKPERVTRTTRIIEDLGAD